MGNTINILPKEISGSELAEVIKKTASQLGWKYRRYDHDYIVSSSSVKIQPKGFTLMIRPGFFGGSMRTTLEPTKTYSEFDLDSYERRIKKSNLELFASTLYKLLGETKS